MAVGAGADVAVGEMPILPRVPGVVPGTSVVGVVVGVGACVVGAALVSGVVWVVAVLSL